MLAPSASYYVVVPTAYNDGTAVADDYLRTVAGSLADQFGGCSVEPGGSGYWWSDTRGLVADGHTVIWSCADDTPANDQFVETLASRIAADLAQECVLIGKRPETTAFVAAAPLAATLAA